MDFRSHFLFYVIFNCLLAYSVLFWAIVALAFLLQTIVSPDIILFSNIFFKTFSQFIGENFDPAISLAFVLCVVFSLTENPELLALHTRQQKGIIYKGGNSVTVTGWIKCLLCLI